MRGFPCYSVWFSWQLNEEAGTTGPTLATKAVFSATCPGGSGCGQSVAKHSFAFGAEIWFWSLKAFPGCAAPKLAGVQLTQLLIVFCQQNNKK